MWNSCRTAEADANFCSRGSNLSSSCACEWGSGGDVVQGDCPSPFRGPTVAVGAALRRNEAAEHIEGWHPQLTQLSPAIFRVIFFHERSAEQKSHQRPSPSARGCCAQLCLCYCLQLSDVLFSQGLFDKHTALSSTHEWCLSSTNVWQNYLHEDFIIPPKCNVIHWFVQQSVITLWVMEETINYS